MKILLTGANGYIGTRLLPVLLEKGHEIVCLVRDNRRFRELSNFEGKVQLITGDLLKQETLEFPADIDAAYYLAHSSIGAGLKDFCILEELAANNFVAALGHTNIQQVIYLGGIINDDHLSPHLNSRLNVEQILKSSGIAYTILRTSLIIGSGSTSFEIIRDLTEKIPVMIAPKWIKTRCQPIAVCNVLEYLKGVLNNYEAYNQTFDIGGPDILTYKEMLLSYAEIRKLNRYILTLPFLTPRLSSYWLYFVTSISFPMGQNLVDCLKNEAICRDTRIRNILQIQTLTYKEALKLAFDPNRIINFKEKPELKRA